MRKFLRLFRRRKETAKPGLRDVHISAFALLDPAGQIVTKGTLPCPVTLHDGMTLRGDYAYEYLAEGGLSLPPPSEVDADGEWTTFAHTPPTYLSDTAGWVEATFESPLPRGRTVRTALQVREERA